VTIEITLLGTGSPIPNPNRAGPATLVLTHYVPAIGPGQEDQWRALAATEFSAPIVLGDDLHQVVINRGE